MTVDTKIRVLVTFDIFSSNRTVSELSELLQITPDVTYTKGELIGNSIRKVKRNRWTLQETGSDLNQAETVLVSLIDRVQDAAEALNTLPKDVELRIAVCLAWEKNDPSPGIVISHSILHFLCENNIALEIATEIYP